MREMGVSELFAELQELAAKYNRLAMVFAEYPAAHAKTISKLEETKADRDNLGVALEAALADLAEARAERDDALDALAAIRGGPDG